MIGIRLGPGEALRYGIDTLVKPAASAFSHSRTMSLPIIRMARDWTPADCLPRQIRASEDRQRLCRGRCFPSRTSAAAIGRPAIGVDPHGIDAEERCACAFFEDQRAFIDIV
jgi:hypothetical protein